MTANTYDGDGSPTSYSGKALTFDIEDRLTAKSFLTAGYYDDGTRAWKQPFNFSPTVRNLWVRCGVRDYDSGTARWLERDPISYEGGINVYSFCENNQVTHADPSGLDMWDNLWGGIVHAGSSVVHGIGNAFHSVGQGLSSAAVSVVKGLKWAFGSVKMNADTPTLATTPYFDPGTPETYTVNGRFLQGGQISDYIDQTGGEAGLAIVLGAIGGSVEASEMQSLDLSSPAWRQATFTQNLR